ncbi:MAG: hypothetical protein SGI73_01950 [Chloroflexota bacterium]|nr:hypothetical protein [Chloroflexota bacterium]
MTDRLERALIAVARRYAPELVPPTWQMAGDYPAPLHDLARALASNGALALMGDLAPGATQSSAALYFREWVDGYTRLYSVLCAALFPSYTEVSGFFVDQEQPPVVVIAGAAVPLIEVLATLIAPYIVMRQGAASVGVTAGELDNVLRVALDELEASDLPPDAFARVQADGVAALRTMLNAQIRQFVLVPMARDVFAPPLTGTPPVPEAGMPPPPPTLPL